MRLISGILDILIYFWIRHSFMHLRPVILSADWSIRGLQSWTCSRLPTVFEYLKLTQSIVINIQRQSADLYQVQHCRYSRFDFRVEKNCWEPAEHRLVRRACLHHLLFRNTDLPSLSIIFAVFRDFFTEAAIRLENWIS